MPEPIPEGVPQRLISQIEWYGKMADRHMRWYQSLKTIQILTGVTIPIVAVLAPDDCVRGATAILGSVVAGIEGIVQFRQFHRHWMRWRAAEQDLISEMWLFNQSAGKYGNPASKAVLLAETTEEIIKRERKGWINQEKQNQPKPNPVGSATP